MRKDGVIFWEYSPDEIRAAYGPIYAVGPEDLAEDIGLDCPMPWVYESDYSLYEGPLPAGTYTLTFTNTLDQPVNDGLHACTDISGLGDIDPPSLYRGTYEMVSYIVVE